MIGKGRPGNWRIGVNRHEDWRTANNPAKAQPRTYREKLETCHNCGQSHDENRAKCPRCGAQRME